MFFFLIFAAGLALLAFAFFVLGYSAGWTSAAAECTQLEGENRSLRCQVEGFQQAGTNAGILQARFDSALAAFPFLRQVLAEAIDDLENTLAGANQLPPPPADRKDDEIPF